MEPTLGSAPADLHHAGDVVLLAPKDWTDAKEALSKLAHAASDQRRHAAGSDFSAGPRLTDSSLDTMLHRAGANDDPKTTILPTGRPSPGRRTSRSLARFLAAACVGAALTLAWQSYGGTAEQMVANAAPQLGWLMPQPATDTPSGVENVVEQASTPAAPAQTGTAASAENAAAATPSEPALDLRQLEAMSHDLAVMRESLAQLGAGQEQIARDIAKLQTDAQDIRRRISAYPVAISARKPVPPPQPTPQPPQLSMGPPAPPPPAPQSSAASQSSAAPLPQGTVQSSTAPAPLAPEPPRPPMPVR
jgi:hypothetical protein